MMNDEALSLSSHLTLTSGSALVSINKVTRRRSRLVLRWVTMCRFNSRCGTMTFISVCNEPLRLRSTQPGHPSVSRCNEYQPKGGEWVAGKTLWSHFYTYICANTNSLTYLLESFRDKGLIVQCYINSSVHYQFIIILIIFTTHHSFSLHCSLKIYCFHKSFRS